MTSLRQWIDEKKEMFKEVTPGPWRSYLGFTPPQEGLYSRIESDSQIVGFVFDKAWCDGKTCDANAIAQSRTLIPKLLEALEIAIDELEEFAQYEGEGMDNGAIHSLEKIQSILLSGGR